MTKITFTDYQKVADRCASGIARKAVAAEFGITTARVSQILKDIRLNGPVASRISNHKRKVSAEQRNAVAEMYKAGSTLEEVGNKFGITRERVRQIVKALGVTRLDGGSAIRLLKNIPAKVDAARAKNERQELRIRATWGMSLSDYRAHISEYGSSAIGSSPMGKYQQHRKNALARGLAWNFTFAEWWRVWQESGKWDERGRGAYVMARYGDADTPYSAETVYICTQSQNSKDSFIVRPDRRAGVRVAMDEQIARVQQMQAERQSQQSPKLTVDEVRNIRIDARRGAEIAATYGISTATVSQIRTRKIWKHV